MWADLLAVLIYMFYKLKKILSGYLDAFDEGLTV